MEELINQKIDLSYLRTIVDFCKKFYVEEVFVQGGESTLFPEIYDFCNKLVLETKSHLSMVTNGSLFDAKWAELYAKRGNDVNFSLNAVSAQKYKELCGGDFEKTVTNIKNFIQLNNSYPEPRCIVQISMVVCTETIDTMADFYDLAIELGVQKVQLFPDICSQYKLKTDDPVFLEKAHQAFDRLLLRIQARPELECSTLTALARCLNYKKELPVIVPKKQFLARSGTNQRELIHYEPIPQARKYKSCQHPWTSIFISDSQDVYPCCLALKESWGNLKNQSLQKIMQSKKRRQFQNQFAQGNVSMCSNSCQLLYL